MTQTIDTTQTLLVGIEMGLPRQSRELKQVATKAEQQAKAAAGTTRASLHYWKWEEGNKKHDGLEPLKEFQSAYKRALEHFARFPFATGAKLLPAALAESFFKVKEQYDKQRPEIWKHWAYEDYPKLAVNAPTRMGAFYSGEDFPSLDECMEFFRCEVTVIPLASADQWQRIAILAPDLAAAQQKLTDQAYNKGIAEAHAKLWAQVMEPIEHAVTTLSKDKAKIFDTLVGNIIDIVDLLPAYNTVLNDPKLNELAAQAKAAFGAIKPDDLRSSNEAKAKMLESAKSIVNSFKPYQRKLVV